MTAYLVRRLLHMIPILLGVCLLTFFLFNVAGGDQAAVVLGKNATAEALQQYEELRGLNKPLVAGWWKTTRAFSFAPYRNEPLESVRLQQDQPLELTSSFPLKPGRMYRWAISGRSDQTATLHIKSSEWSTNITLTSGAFNKTLRMNVQPDFEGIKLAQTGADYVEIQDVVLHEKNASILDSQLFHYMRQMFTFDFGVSVATHQRVSTMLRDGVGPSLCLTVPIFIGSLILSVCLALVCAYFRDRAMDRMLVLVATVLMSVNYVVWVVAGQYVFAYRLQWFPLWGFESWRYLLLPVFIGIVTTMGRDLRFYRTVMLEELHRDYVRTARAKGAGGGAVLFRHVLANAWIPILTNVSMALPFLFTGSILLESFFGIPGLGGLSVNAIHSADLDVIRAVVFLGAVLYVVFGAVTDILYAWVDPRIRLG